MQKSTCSIRLSELAEQFGLQCVGNGDAIIDGVGTLAEATPSQVSFLSNPSYRAQLGATRAAAVIIAAAEADDCPVTALVADDPYASYARVAGLFDPRRPAAPGVHPSASVDASTRLGRDVHVAANAVIGPGCVIGDGCAIGPGCVLVADCSLGAGTRLVANVTLCDGVVIGKRCIIHPGAVIGGDGFGLAMDAGRWLKIPQIGSVRIGNDCEVGANTTIDRGAIGDTVLGDDVRLDNLVQIAHNVEIGAHTAMAGMVGISGSTKIGEYCMFAGNSGCVGHISIADRTTVNAQSMVTKSIAEPGTTWSSAMPARPLREWNRIAARINRLEQLARRVMNLEKQSGNQQQDD